MRAVLRVSGREDEQAARALLESRGYAVSDGDCSGADLVVVDEWTPETANHVVEARAGGVPTTVLAELLLEDADGPVVAVTGTAGKTSTCHALAHILSACGTTVAMSRTARSNNAWPDHSLMGQMPPSVTTIAELTSTHLCHMGSARTDVAVVTMLRPDHGELHGSVESYLQAKRRLANEVAPGGALVLPTDDPTTLDALGPLPSVVQWGFGEDPGTGPGAHATGGHVRISSPTGDATTQTPAEGPALRAVLAAGAAALACGVDPQAVAAALHDVPVVPHRMSSRTVGRGVTLIDDTMAATPLKAAAALRRMTASSDLVVVLGGDDAPQGIRVHASSEEQAALRDAVRLARDTAGVLVTFGAAAERIEREVAADARAPDISRALTLALARCAAGGTVLVSPMFPMTPAERQAVAGV